MYIMKVPAILRTWIVSSWLLLGYSFAICPHQDATLQKWSDASTWNNNQIPGQDIDVVIKPSQAVLLDEQVGNVDVSSITIETGGRLVFDDDDLHLRTKYIRVKGRLDIGSEDCPLGAEIQIVLRGNKGEYSITGFGEKFIGVEEGGSLEIHGQYQLPWTKLTKSITRIQESTISEQMNIPQETRSNKYLGLIIYVMDAGTGAMESAEGIFTGLGGSTRVAQGVERVKNFISGIPDGKIVGIVVKRSLRIASDLSELYEAIEKLAFGEVTGQSLLRQYYYRSAYAMLTKKGSFASTQEELKLDNGKDIERVVELEMLENRKIFSVKTTDHSTKRWLCVTRARVVDADKVTPIIDLLDDVTSWKTGDTIVVLSTDYDWKQAETASILDCGECSKNQIKYDIDPQYNHFGEVYKNVDMRGEVALLSRNIVIEGEPATNSKMLGGHVKFLKGFQDVHVENVEFRNMGQQDSLGNYLLHYHMCHDVDGDQYPNPTYLRGNSIHHSFARCITVHGTHGAQVKDNVCYDTLGHGFFLEDGGEKRTVFDGNLGAGQRQGNLIPTDMLPTTFWITNPQTYMRNNVAAGSDGQGYWLIYPDIPMGPSAGLGFMQEEEAKHTAVFQFENNVAHSNLRLGFMIDNKLTSDGQTERNSNYEPWNKPLDPTSGPKEVVLNRLTGYKNERHNAWIAGGFITVTNSSFSDSLDGITFKRSAPQEQFISNCVFLGESANVGQPMTVKVDDVTKSYPRSVPRYYTDSPRKGVTFYHGPIFVKDSWFGDFKKTADYDAGALGFQSDNVGHNSPYNVALGLKFGFTDPTGGYIIIDGELPDDALDGDIVASFRDLDGSVTSVPDTQIVKPIPFHTTASCQDVDHWNVAVCPYRYGQFVLYWTGSPSNMLVYRDDEADFPIKITQADKGVFMTILGGSHSYILKFDGGMPRSKFYITADGITKTDSVRFGVCVPRDAKLWLRMTDPANTHVNTVRFIEVGSLQEVEESNSVQTVYFDREVGIVFMKAIHALERNDTDSRSCPDGVCPVFHMQVLEGDLSDCDCISRAYPKYGRLPTAPDADFLGKVQVPDPVADPPTTWGAGATR